jgi:hypothetical protein
MEFVCLFVVMLAASQVRSVIVRVLAAAVIQHAKVFWFSVNLKL